MKDKYYELKVISSQIEPLKDLVFEFGFTCIEEINGGFIIRDEESLDDTKWGLEEFASRFGCEITTDLQIKDNIDWINEYKKGIAPVAAGDFYIRPSWEKPKDGLIDIIIDPALAFGSGHHESTNSCLKLISKYAKNYKEALDVGCGSGILSIAMAKLGLSVSSCDTDELEVQSTSHNAKINGVNIEDIWTGSVTNSDKSYDIVVANIIADVILFLANDLKSKVKTGGLLILSGILTKYKSRIIDAFSQFELVENLTQNEWESFVFKNQGK